MQLLFTSAEKNERDVRMDQWRERESFVFFIFDI